MFFLEQFKQEFQSRLGIGGVFQFSKQTFGPVQNSGFKIILSQFEDSLLALVVIQIGTIYQVVVHAQGAIHLATAAEQTTQRKVQFDRMRIDLDHFDKGLNGLILLLIEQKIQTLEI